MFVYGGQGLVLEERQAASFVCLQVMLLGQATSFGLPPGDFVSLHNHKRI